LSAKSCLSWSQWQDSHGLQRQQDLAGVKCSKWHSNNRWTFTVFQRHKLCLLPYLYKLGQHFNITVERPLLLKARARLPRAPRASLFWILGESQLTRIKKQNSKRQLYVVRRCLLWTAIQLTLADAGELGCIPSSHVLVHSGCELMLSSSPVLQEDAPMLTTNSYLALAYHQRTAFILWTCKTCPILQKPMRIYILLMKIWWTSMFTSN